MLMRKTLTARLALILFFAVILPFRRYRQLS